MIGFSAPVVNFNPLLVLICLLNTHTDTHSRFLPITLPLLLIEMLVVNSNIDANMSYSTRPATEVKQLVPALWSSFWFGLQVISDPVSDLVVVVFVRVELHFFF